MRQATTAKTAKELRRESVTTLALRDMDGAKRRYRATGGEFNKVRLIEPKLNKERTAAA